MKPINVILFGFVLILISMQPAYAELPPGCHCLGDVSDCSLDEAVCEEGSSLSDCENYGHYISSDKIFCQTNGTKKTTFKVPELLEDFNIRSLPTGELELSKDKNVIGFIYGTIRKIGDKYAIENGGFRRRTCSKTFCYETILKSKSDIKFTLKKWNYQKSEYYSLRFPSDVEIVTTAVMGKDKEVFSKGLKNAPIRIDNKVVYATMLSCSKDCSPGYWMIEPSRGYPNKDRFSISGDYEFKYLTLKELKKSRPKYIKKSKLKTKRGSYLSILALPWPHPKSVDARMYIRSKFSFDLDNVKFGPKDYEIFYNNKKYLVFGKSIDINYDNIEDFIFTSSLEAGNIKRQRGSYFLKSKEGIFSYLSDGDLETISSSTTTKSLSSYYGCKKDDNRACFVHSGISGKLYLPRYSANPIDLTIIFPKNFEKISLEDVMLENNQLPTPKREIRLCNDAKICMVWKNGEDIRFSPNSATWKDLGFSFYVDIYDKNSGTARKLGCNKDKGCYIDSHPISSLKKLKECNSNNDCRSISKNAVCKRGLCIHIDKDCKKLSGTGPIDILYMGIGYNSLDTLKADALKYSNELFSVAPFSSSKDAFTLWYKRVSPNVPPGTQIDNWIITNLNKFSSCKNNPDYMFILVNQRFWYQGIAMKNNVILSTLASMPYTAVHEFGHAFGGLADEYYIYTPGRTGNSMLQPGKHAVNCARSVSEAKKMWGEQLTQKAIKSNWRGCGAICDKRCASYLKPSKTSIMKSPAESHNFNSVSQAEIQNIINRFVGNSFAPITIQHR